MLGSFLVRVFHGPSGAAPSPIRRMQPSAEAQAPTWGRNSHHASKGDSLLHSRLFGASASAQSKSLPLGMWDASREGDVSPDSCALNVARQRRQMLGAAMVPVKTRHFAVCASEHLYPVQSGEVHATLLSTAHTLCCPDRCCDTRPAQPQRGWAERTERNACKQGQRWTQRPAERCSTASKDMGAWATSCLEMCVAGGKAHSKSSSGTSIVTPIPPSGTALPNEREFTICTANRHMNK